MRTSIAVLGLLALLVPTVAVAQDPPPATAPPPAGTPETAPPPPTATNPGPAATTPMVSAGPGSAPSLKGVSVWGILPWGGFGVGARFMIPIGIPSLIHHPRIKDNWALEFGGDYLHFNYGGLLGSNYSWSEVVVVGSLMWNVWLTPDFAVYPKAEIGYAFGWFSGYDDTLGPRPTYGGFFPNGAGGLLYKLNNGITLRAEAGSANLKLGAGFLF
jgi:hypothetical protein